MPTTEKPREFGIELTDWRIKYAFWVNEKRQRKTFEPYFDSLQIGLIGNIIVPSSACYADAKISMHHHDGYSDPIETKEPHPIIGHIHYCRPVLEGEFSVPQRMISPLLTAIDRGVTRYFYLHSDQLKRIKAYVPFDWQVDLEEFSDPTR